MPQQLRRGPALGMTALAAGRTVIVAMTVAVVHEKMHEGAREQEQAGQRATVVAHLAEARRRQAELAH